MRIPIHVSARTFLVLAGFLFTSIGLVFVHTAAHDLARERAYRRSGELIEALVVAKSIDRASREGNSSTSYKVVYRFAGADGRALEGEETVSVEEWESLAPGSLFKIAYLPGAGTSRGAGASQLGMALGMMALGSVFAVIGGVFLLITARRLRKEWRLLRHGIAAQGAVRAIEPSALAVNGVRQWIVRYEYRDHHGQTRQGKSEPLPPAEARAGEGETCEVRYDPARPEESMWVRRRASPPPGRWTRLKNFALVPAVLLVAIIVGESVPAFKALDELAAAHAMGLTAITVAMTAAGFVLFMGGVLYRLFSSRSEPMSHQEVEDLSRSVRIDARPVAARVSAYRFRGSSAGASFGEAFNLKEAKQAWRERAWRTSPRWRANFVVSAGALLFTVGLFGFFVVDAPTGIKLLFIAVLVYGAVRVVVALNQTEVS